MDDDGFELYYNILYGCFAWPNIVLPFIAGFLADKVGSRIVLFSLCICLVIGSALFYVGFDVFADVFY